ncbi:Cytochrome c553 [Rubritalea squalenifaciens DSM 18772]|uniref:Cytochrome c553 n=1 Tax=Rubritalea squalenifaciens DSM 18772 TaxID=1123071 RepID=A0A1M6S9T0_9BACT|nr:cytochrome c [Rubritalea squalenifaciens]SHK41429.1 Cytochrome c553 [Rubritalea squalenifaciens DSM 18772]
MSLKITSAVLIAVLITPLSLSAGNGEQLYKMNCAACHQVENRQQPVVGPSLVEVNHLYAKKPKKYLEWCKEPGKKRKDAIQMPSMAHIPDEDLLDILEYIKTATKGKKFKPEKGVKPDPYKLTGEAAKKPRMQRIFMKDTSPASIAVTIDGQQSLCWDTVSCRMRYAWSGGFIDGYAYWKGNGNDLATPVGEIYYRAPGELRAGLVIAGTETAPKYQGYSVAGGLPTFLYQLGPAKVKETILSKDGKLAIRIQVEGSSAEVRYPLGDLAKTDVTHSAGKLDKGMLVLTASEAKDFTLTFNAK